MADTGRRRATPEEMQANGDAVAKLIDSGSTQAEATQKVAGEKGISAATALNHFRATHPERIQKRGSSGRSARRASSTSSAPDHMQTARDAVQRALREFEAKREALEQDVEEAKLALEAHLATKDEIVRAAEALGIPL